MNTEQQGSSCIDPRDMNSCTAPLSPPASTSGAGSSLPDTPSIRPSTSSSNKKKRKSWGQVLPEPTTNLPPRKRAKTDAEKQQRLYERVQRNRAAAHNSRMRKQNEMEDVMTENNRLRQDVQALKMEVERLSDENKRLHQQPKEENVPTSEFDSSSLYIDIDHSPPTPSLISGPSDDSSSLHSEQFQSQSSLQFTTDPSLEMKHSDDSHSAVDVGVAGFSDGFGLGINTDMTNDFNYDFPFTNDPLPNMTDNVDIDSLINLDGLVDSKDTASNNQNWLSSYIPGFEPQIHFDPMTLMSNNVAHLPTLSTPPLF